MKRIFFAAAAALLLALTGCAGHGGRGLPGSAPPTPSPIVSPAPPYSSLPPEPDPSPTPAADDPLAAQLAGMTQAQKVGQLLMAGIYGLEAGADAAYAVQTVQVGGVILFGRNVDSCGQAAGLSAGLHALNAGGVPLLIAADQEGGPVSRMPEEVVSLPAAYVWGAAGDPALCRGLGGALAAQCAAIGVNLDFAPVADVWSNPDNTVIGRRALAADPETVSALVPQVMEGLSGGGVIPVVKHFPGHGDTRDDSHYDLPLVEKTPEQLEELELKPFRAAIEAGAPAVMVGHLLVRALDDRLPASLSPAVVDGLLRDELGFEGVVFTDDLTMGAVSRTCGIGEAAVLAVEAGCDMLLVCHGGDNLRLAYEALLAAADSGRISRERLDESVSRILALKAAYGVSDAAVSAPDVDALNRQLSQLLDRLE